MVRETELRVARQREIVASLDANKFPTEMALTRLADFEAALVRHRQRLKELEGNGRLPVGFGAVLFCGG